jgi:hypothetical protein
MFVPGCNRMKSIQVQADREPMPGGTSADRSEVTVAEANAMFAAVKVVGSTDKT